ncbi:hypothetical protein RFI_03136 [Reticulomyxa filosa]|uniref:Uncharacterized protein n=1 Tax=Reticulomyxa filosa TaxID=46433 RepID=X6P621_RETFI|nr:hypothetical protein RFI_03136 [Reticulomyxa filosa]|eukprot:ETO33960.1 hypothetical protein RFI_03136 [Reticulomyxa filosa]
MNITLNYFMDKKNDKNEHQNTRIKCIQLINEISNEQQLNEAFNSSMDIFTDKNDDKDVRRECAELLGTIAVNLNGKHFDDAFKCLINGFKGSSEWNHKLYAESIGYLSMKLNKKQLDNVFECLNGSKDENECIRELCEKLLETTSTKLNDQQLNRVYNAFIYGLKDNYIWGHKSCAKPLGKIATKASKKQREEIVNALMGATFLLGMSQKQLKEILIENNLLYWAAGRSIILIKAENSNVKKFDEGWDPFSFLTF